MRIGVVVPTLEEEGRVGPLVRALLAERDEVIVVDGGSADATVAEARAAGARVRVSPGATRAVALNTGAALSSADIVYFVHADCRPPAGFAAEIERAVRGGAGAGCFRLRFDSRHWLLRLSGWCTRLDLDLVRFGDQSLFVLRDLLRSVAGFDERLAVMEDNEIVRRLRRVSRFEVVPRDVTASARAYRVRGVYRLQLGVYPLL